MDTLIDYYTDEDNLMGILSSVGNPRWRVWKVLDADGKFRQNDKTLFSTTKLMEFLLNIDDEGNICSEPYKVYVSVALFFEPKNVYGKNPKKSQWVIADSQFISSELLFDCDDETDISIAHEDCKKIIEFMRNEDEYDLINIRYSGTKGFHLLYGDNSRINEDNPLKRTELTEEKRKELVNRLPELKTIDEIHKRIIADQFRVHAALGTIKADTGNIVKEIPLKDFITLSTTQLMELYVHSPVRPVKGPMMERISTSTSGKERSGLSSSHSFHFIDNMVHGIKDRYVAVLKYPKEKKIINIIRNLQKTYNLSHFYRLHYKESQILINCKILDKQRLEKIMRASHCMNFSSFKYYGHAWIPVTDTQLIDCFPSEYGLKHEHSRPHANLLNVSFDIMAGKAENKVGMATVVER